MKIRSFCKENYGVIMAGLMGALMFFILFGFSALDITGSRLFSRGDPGMHYIGWRFFRNAPWQLFPGLMNNLDYPYSVSVIFTDSIPLMAVIFKAFQVILPEKFNYLGLWILFSFIMQGIMSYKLLSLRIRSKVFLFCGVIFFLLTPAFIKRTFWHTALVSHFLILISLYLLISDSCILLTVRKQLFLWALLGIACASVHLYFLGICGLTALFTGIDRWQREESGKGFIAFLIPVFFGLSGLFTVWILGGFESGMSAGAPGFGYYSFNLNSFINGDSWSRFLRFPYYEGAQVEGFAYLGLGMLIIILIAGVFGGYHMLSGLAGNPAKAVGSLGNTGVNTGVKNSSDICSYNSFNICAALGITALLFAVSNVITFSDRVLFSFDLSDAGGLLNVLEIFRSSGRFAWITMYLLMLYGFYGFAGFAWHLRLMINRGKSGERTAPAGEKGWSSCYVLGTAVLLLLLFLQIYDLFPGLYSKAEEVREAEEYESMLDDSYWEELAESGKYRHLVFMDKENLTEEELYSLAFFAADNNMTINDFNFGRAAFLNSDKIAADSAAHPSEDTVYVFTSVPTGTVLIGIPHLSYREADMLLVGIYEPE